MSQIKVKQQEKESGAWNGMTPQQKQEQEGLLRQLGMLARYHNVMANHTIHALQLLTTRITSIFCHPTFVDRIAAMLNYFLCCLVRLYVLCVVVSVWESVETTERYLCASGKYVFRKHGYHIL